MLDSIITARVYEFVARHIRRHGYPPTIRQIQAGCGIRSTSSVKRHLDALERDGRIARDAHLARAIRLMGQAA